MLFHFLVYFVRKKNKKNTKKDQKSKKDNKRKRNVLNDNSEEESLTRFMAPEV